MSAEPQEDQKVTSEQHVGVEEQCIGNEDICSSPIYRRLLALKKLQIETLHIDAEFHKRIFALDTEFQRQYQTLFDQRNRIVCGQHEPNDDECKVPPIIAKETKRNLLEKLTNSEANNQTMGAGEQPTDGSTVGIPNFWLQVFKNSTSKGAFLVKDDENAISHLKDIKIKSSLDNELSFQIEFYFDQNAYFENDILTKQYQLSCEFDENDLFAFEGPELCHSIGCDIKWKEGMNLIEKEPNSFFKFFDPPKLADIMQTVTFENPEGYRKWNKSIANYERDFEIGLFIKENLVPRAVLYYLNENYYKEISTICGSGNSIGDGSDDDDEDDDDHEGDPNAAPCSDEQIVSEMNYLSV